MSVEDLDAALAPVIEVLESQNDLITELHDAVTHLSEVQYGVIMFMGVLAGILLIYLLFRRF